MPLTWSLPRLLLGGTALLLVAVGCSRGDQSATPGAPGTARPALPVLVAQARTEHLTDRLRAVGTLTANESVLIRPEIPGRVERIHFEEGQPVKAGEPLITLDAAEYRAQVAQTEATVTVNRLNFQRALDLVKTNMLSQQDYDQAQARLAESRALLQRHQVMLAKTVLRAPFDGVAGLRQVSPGAYVQPGQDLVNLEDLDPLKIEFRVPERHAGAMTVGRALMLRVDAVSGREFSGEIYAIDPRLDAATRTFALRGRVPNSDGLLRPGMFAQVELTVGERPQAIVIPEQAIVPRGEKLYVFKVVDGRVVFTPVGTGLRLPGIVEIVEGLGVGDTVVTEGQMKLRDGMPVAAQAPETAP
ncbi:efflux RND transporter periplasmic adaptor subunit [Immundisolibacter sp.]|uniref:efflux RND transporter periplasmic adaptor subunit n=1 Tax=Immundisolibacter sp. TaxID=1934948 RepID=UPI003561D6CC